MKKLYITPNSTTINVKTQNLMQFGSPTSDSTINGGGNKGNYSGGQASRSALDWDDEE